MGNTKRTTKQSIKQRETMENELTTRQELEKLENATKEFSNPFINQMQKPVEWIASVFNCFKKRKRKTLEHKERDKGFQDGGYCTPPKTSEAIRFHNEIIEAFRNSKNKDIGIENIKRETPLAFLNDGYCDLAPKWNWETMEWEGLQNTYTKKAFAFKAPTIEVIDCPGQQSSRIYEDVINRIKEDLFNRYSQMDIKRTQSVAQRIHARPRKSAQIVKHKRVMRRKLIDVIQLDSRPDIDLVLNLINIHIDASFNEYQGDFNKLF